MILREGAGMAVEIVAEEKRQAARAGKKLTEQQKKLLMAVLEIAAQRTDGVVFLSDVAAHSGVAKRSIYYAVNRMIALQFLEEVYVLQRGGGRAVRSLVGADFVAGIIPASRNQAARVSREEADVAVLEEKRQAARDAYAGRRYEDDPAASRERVHGYVPGRAYNRSLTGNGMENA